MADQFKGLLIEQVLDIAPRASKIIVDTDAVGALAERACLLDSIIAGWS